MPKDRTPKQEGRYTIACKRCLWQMDAKMTLSKASNFVILGLCPRCRKHGLEAHSDRGITLTHPRPGQLQADVTAPEGETTNG